MDENKKDNGIIVIENLIEAFDSLKEKPLGVKEMLELNECIKQLLPIFILLLEVETEVIATLDWMITDMKWKADENRSNLEEGSKGGYSEELTKASLLLNRLKGNTNEGII